MGRTKRIPEKLLKCLQKCDYLLDHIGKNLPLCGAGIFVGESRCAAQRRAFKRGVIHAELWVKMCGKGLPVHRKMIYKSTLLHPRILLGFILCLAAIALSSETSADQGFTGVTCSSAADCWAVGVYVNSTNRGQTLIEQWNGSSWSLITSPDTSTSTDNDLLGGTCTSAADCWAVGHYALGIVDQTLIERWNGTSWSIIPSPNYGTSYNHDLRSVTCSSASDCWAVGSYDNSSGTQTLIERWNGISWSIVPSPNYPSPTGDGNYLVAATCNSTSDCWAVGSYYNGNGVPQTLIEYWDGQSWSIVPSPNNGATHNELDSVTCTSTTDCWAVGSYYNNSNFEQTLVEYWDGQSWSIVPSPNVLSPTNTTWHNHLDSVTCSSAADCWAVGDYHAGTNDRTLIQHWDGTSWSIVSSLNQGANNALTGVKCTSTSDCWAVGHQNGHTLTEHWDGTSWSIVPSPNAVTVFTSSSPSAGGTTSGGGTYASGTSITVTATPSSGYMFTKWTRGSSVVSTSASYTFSATANSTLVAHFIQTYAISTSASPSVGGATSGAGTYTKGASVTVNATPNSGYTFTNWTQNGNIVSHSASYTFTANANRVLVANFTTNPVTLTTSASPSNGGTTSGDGTYATGANVTAKAVPASGYTFTNWTANSNIVSHLAPYTFKLNSNTKLVANFTTNPVTVATSSSPNAGGTTSGGGTYANGASIAVIATAKTGYTFTNWTENGSVVSTSPTYAFTATANRTLIANFTP